MLIRVPDDLHKRLTALAHDDGVSVNALANQILTEAVAARTSPEDVEQQKIRDKARTLGLLVDSTMPPLSADRVNAAIDSTKGMGPVLADLWSEGR